MTEPEPQQTESSWGINPKDRKWFFLLAGTAGTALAATLAVLMIANRGSDETIDHLLSRIVLNGAAAYPLSGFLSWMILGTKDLMMSFADDMRKRTAKRVAGIREEGRMEGRVEGRQEGRIAMLDKLDNMAETTNNQELRDMLDRLRNEDEQDNA